MKRIVFVVILTFIIGLTSVNAQKLLNLLSSIPDSTLTKYVTNSDWKAMITNFENGDTTVVKNMFNDTISIKKITDNYALVKLNDIVTLELKLLDDSTIAAITTYFTPEAESKLKLYSTAWKPLPYKLPTPTLIVKPTTMTNEQFIERKSKIVFTMTQYKLSEKDNSLFVSCSFPLISKDDYLSLIHISEPTRRP